MDNTEMQVLWDFSACTLGCGKSKKMTEDVQGGSSTRGADKPPDMGRKDPFFSIYISPSGMVSMLII